MFTNFFQVRVPFFSGVLGAFLGFYLLLVVGNLALQLGLCRYFLLLVLASSFPWVLSDLCPFVGLVSTLSLPMSTLISGFSRLLYRRHYCGEKAEEEAKRRVKANSDDVHCFYVESTLSIINHNPSPSLGKGDGAERSKKSSD